MNEGCSLLGSNLLYDSLSVLVCAFAWYIRFFQQNIMLCSRILATVSSIVYQEVDLTLLNFLLRLILDRNLGDYIPVKQQRQQLG